MAAPHPYLSQEEVDYITTIGHSDALQACTDVGMAGVQASTPLETLRMKLCLHYGIAPPPQAVPSVPPVPFVPPVPQVLPEVPVPIAAPAQPAWAAPAPPLAPRISVVAASAAPTGRRAVLRQGWLEKKGGDTHIGSDNVLRKERHYSKGGRRNWKLRFFILYGDGELAYFDSADGRPGEVGGAEPKGRLRLATEAGVASWHVRDGTNDFLLGLPGQNGSDQKAMLLRTADPADRQAWMETTVDAFGATVGPLLFDKDERGVAEGALRWVRKKVASAPSESTTTTTTTSDLTTNEAVALFDFAPEQPTDLALKVGMKLVLLETEGEWWRGYAADQPDVVGSFPCTFVERGSRYPRVPRPQQPGDGAAPPPHGRGAGGSPRRAVIREGWLEKKGGDTHIGSDNVLRKERHYSKGGRRNWKRRWFMLFDDGELVYFSSADGRPGQVGKLT
jgi:hypothetical protein